MDHFAFIAASYAVSLLGLGLLAAWLLVDNAAQKRALEELEARGVKRRSTAPAASAPVSPAAEEGKAS